MGVKLEVYIIKKTTKHITSPNDAEWKKAEIAVVDKVNWPEYGRAINTNARILYGDDGLFVRMETDEKPLLARHTEPNSAVCRDSCMEFFISPNKEDKRYINFEFNPFGTMHMSVRVSNDEWSFADYGREYFEVQSFVSSKSWVLMYHIPFKFFEDIFGVYTKEMKGNLYKCGGETVKKHYISYNPIYTKEPKFHSPEFFGGFVLE